MGLVRTDSRRHVQRFVEKPQDDETIDAFRVEPRLFEPSAPIGGEAFLGSMGLYVFKPEVLARALEGASAVDFGTGIFQSAIGKYKVMAYPFSGYWRDIGTVEAFFEANLALTRPQPPFTLYAPGWPIYTRTRPLSPNRVVGSEIRDSLLAEGAYLNHAHIVDSVIGLRSIVGEGSSLRKVVLFGADFYEGERLLTAQGADGGGEPSMGIGRDCSIECAIIDKNVRIGDNVVISEKRDGQESEGEFHWVRDGVTIIPKGTVIPSGTRI
jgi:glucose-1-phosphate adenylyltransferase